MTDTPDPYSNPVWHALTGRQANLAFGDSDARAYRQEVTRFSAVREPTPDAYRDLARILGPGKEARLFRPAEPEHRPPDWAVALERPILQMIADDPARTPPTPPPPDGLVALGPADGREMLALATATEPGPFEAGTVAIGGFIGVRRQGLLVAMAGHRLKLDGGTEVSGICTAPEHRGQGLARALTLQVMAGIRAAGQTPILHAFPDNLGAIKLYEALGYRLHRELLIRWLVTPDA